MGDVIKLPPPEGAAPKPKARLRFEPISKRWVYSFVIPLFKRWRKPLRQWLSHRAAVPPVMLDDLAQEVFVRLLRYSATEVIDNPQGYLFRIAANVANEWQEKANNRKPHLGVESPEFEAFEKATLDEPEDVVERDEYFALIRLMVEGLPPRQRKLVKLHIWDGLTYKQIAELENLTYRTVLRDLTRAYALLRQRMGVSEETDDD